MHLIIDGDPIVYRAGFAAQSSEYHLVYQLCDEVAEVHFAPGDKQTAGARMKEWLDSKTGIEILDKEHIVIPEPEEHALETVRTQLRSIEKECRDHYGCEFDRITLILSGPGNYREGIATVAPYKGNRDPDHKPYWYQSIRNYLTGQWGAIVVSGREADDECSILARQCLSEGIPFVVATIDKDLDQIPGNHYNYLKQVFYAQSEDAADRFFYQQCLSGDATDGIPGCYRVGEAIAARWIADNWPAEHSSGSRMRLPVVPRRKNDRKLNDLWSGIVEQYRASQAKKGCPYVGRDPAAVALETARLVKLQEYPGQLWRPDGPPHDLLPEFKDDDNT